MQYDFDKQVDRRHTSSMKWDVEEHELPMWVADMDFQTAPEIREALQRRVDRGIFGYEIVPEEWSEAIVNWWARRHHYTMEKEWIIFSTGVVPTISSVVRKLTTPAENVLIQTPVYNIFFNSILNNGRNVLESSLVYDGEGYSIDFDDLEEKLARPQTTMMILCNPHNPVGKIWDRNTLIRIGELCYKHQVIVISDEIHCDLTDPGCEYIPFAAASDICKRISVTCIAPTKCFNLAGLQTSAVVVPDPYLRHKVNRGLNTDEVAEPNSFAIDAAIAAFNEGEPWLEELRTYIKGNKDYVKECVDSIPKAWLVPSEATYLLWLDCKAITDDSEDLSTYIRRETGLYVTAGKEYGHSGDGFLRINVACPKEVLIDGMTRLKVGIEKYIGR